MNDSLSLALGLAPPALARAVLLCLNDTRLIEARAHSSVANEGRLSVTAVPAVLSVIKDHLRGYEATHVLKQGFSKFHGPFVFIT